MSAQAGAGHDQTLFGEGSGLAGELASTQFEVTYPGTSSSDVWRASNLDSRSSTRRLSDLAVKRAIDIALGLVILVVAMPILLIIVLAILLCDGRPIFFKLDEIGKDGRMFRMYKFRTMVADADAQGAVLAEHNEMTGPVFKIRNDPRVTRLGAVLRQYSLDELPQLWSVLKGDMSLVGPRPLRPQEYAAATEFQRQKLSVTPGITCLWQVMGRSQITDFDAWVALDLQYIEQWSILLDLKILARTIPVVLARRGAW